MLQKPLFHANKIKTSEEGHCKEDITYVSWKAVTYEQKIQISIAAYTKMNVWLMGTEVQAA